MADYLRIYPPQPYPEPMEDYAAKMQLKPDEALREYVTGYAQYREAAVLAALDELRRRGQPAPEEVAIRPGLEAAVATQQAAATAVRQEAGTAEREEEEAPALYSPSSILIFSVLPMSSMLTGGVLMGMNLYRLGKKRAVLGLALFVVAYLFLASALLSWAMSRFGLNPLTILLLFNVPAALAYVLWFWPRYVGDTSYRTRGVLAPVLVCLLIMWGLRQITPYLIRQQPPEVRKELERLLPPEK